MKYGINLLSHLESRLLPLRYYTSVSTLSAQTWFDIHESGNKKLLKRNSFLIKLIYFLMIAPLMYLSIWIAVAWLSLGLLLGDYSERAWIILYDEFISKIGLSEQYLKYLENTRRIGRMQCDWCIEPSSILKTNIRIELEKLKEESEKEKKVEFNQVIAALSKAQGYRLNPKKISVLEFYSVFKFHQKK